MTPDDRLSGLVERLENRILDWIGYQLLMHGPHQIVCNPDTKFGTWCLQRAGGHAYRYRSPQP